VRKVTRCRAESFYLTPGDHRKFADWDVYTKVAGDWVQITHRKDVERLSENPSWDKICYVSWGKAHRDADGNHIPMDVRIKDDPRDIELWKLDKKLINGKRSGPEHGLSAIARKGAARAGGVEEAVGAILGKGNVGKLVVRWIKTGKIEPTRQALAIRLLKMAEDVLDPGSLESLAAQMTKSYLPVPVANLSLSTAHNLEFLKRYPPQRRVTLLLDLWQEQELEAAKTCIRLALETMGRGGEIREKSKAFLANLAENHSEAVAKIQTIEPLWNKDASLLYSPKVRDLLKKREKTRNICAFHPDNEDPADALRIIRDRKFLETKSVPLFCYERLHPNTAKALRDELENTKSIEQTHSSNKCYNMLCIAAAICEVDPDAQDLLVRAYSAWSKTNEASERWPLWEVDDALEGRTLKLGPLTVEKLYRIQTDLMRKTTPAPGDQTPPKLGVPGQEGVSTQLLRVLEAQTDTPEGIREICRTHIHYKYIAPLRGNDGMLAPWRKILEDSTDLVGDTRAALKTWTDMLTGGSDLPEHADEAEPSEYTRMVSSRGRPYAPDPATIPGENKWYSTTCQMYFISAAHRPMNDAEYVTLRDLMMTNEHIDQAVRQQTCDTMNEVRDAATGRIVIDPKTVNRYDNPAHAALELYAQTTTEAQREWLISELGDIDVAYIGWLATGKCDLVQIAGRRDETSREIQTSSMVGGIDGITWPEKPRKWKDLPTVDYVPWVLPEKHRALDGKTITLGGETYNVRVLKSMESLMANASANCMGNCTEDYASDIRKGRSLVLAVGRGERTEINVELSGDPSYDTPVASLLWSVGEIKGPRNRPLERAQEETVRDQITSLLL